MPIPRGVYAIADALHLFWILGADVLLVLRLESIVPSVPNLLVPTGIICL